MRKKKRKKEEGYDWEMNPCTLSLAEHMGSPPRTGHPAISRKFPSDREREHMAGKEEKEDRKHQGHEHHHLGLKRIGRGRIEFGLNKHRDGHHNRQYVKRIGRGEVGDPENPRRVSHFNTGEQYPIQREKNRYLHQYGQTAAKGLIFSVL